LSIFWAFVWRYKLGICFWSIICSFDKLNNNYTVLDRHWAFQQFVSLRHHNSIHIKVLRFSGPLTGRLFSQKITLALVPLRGCFYARPTVRCGSRCFDKRILKLNIIRSWCIYVFYFLLMITLSNVYWKYNTFSLVQFLGVQ
jgi:hypothetical protein